MHTVHNVICDSASSITPLTQISQVSAWFVLLYTQGGAADFVISQFIFYVSVRHIISSKNVMKPNGQSRDDIENAVFLSFPESESSQFL